MAEPAAAGRRCPFCGCSDVCFDAAPQPDLEDPNVVGKIWVEALCLGCWAATDAYSTDEQAATAWDAGRIHPGRVRPTRPDPMLLVWAALSFVGGGLLIVWARFLGVF